jgi:spermidine/putrescine transport system permease protein
VLEASGITMESRSQTAPSPVPPRTGGGPNLLRLVEWLFGGWTLAIFLFFYIPIILLIAFSFNSSKLNVIWEGFTLKWYGALLQNRVLLETFKNSVIIAGVTTVVSTVLGTLGGWLLHRYRFPLAGTIGLLIFIPMVIPEVLMGVSLLQLFVQLKIPLGFTTVIIAHITFCFPFVVIAVQARLNGIDPFLEEAAMDLGARPWQAFFKVIVPYLMPSTTAGPNSQTLPLKVYGMAKVGLNPQLNALSTVFVVATVILVLISETINRLRDRKAWAQQ